MTSDVHLKRPNNKDSNKFRFYLAGYFILMICAFWWYKTGKVHTLFMLACIKKSLSFLSVCNFE